MKVHRPYARKRGGPPSVTTVLGTLDKAGLPWAAARETAMFAVHHRDQWDHLPDDAAVTRLRQHHRGVWDGRAAMGSLVHAANEAWAGGENFDIEAHLDEVLRDGKVWRSYGRRELLAEATRMVDALEECWMAIQPETISVEDVVRYTGLGLPYIGQSDWRARLADGRVWLLDLKTTGSPTAGPYLDSCRLQLAAYRFATEVVHYGEVPIVDIKTGEIIGSEIDEIGTEPLTPVDACAILHVRSNGRWGFYPVRAEAEEHAAFMAIRQVHEWLKKDGTGSGAEAVSFPHVKEDVSA